MHPPANTSRSAIPSNPHVAALSALDLIRALKAPMDPPQASDLTKIEIAHVALHSKSLFMPNKREVLAEWLLTRLLKDRARESSANPILDIRYWKLLEELLFSHDATNISEKSQQAWLVPLLNRIPLGPIVVSFISLCPQIDHAPENLINTGLDCLTFLWPPASPKISLEVSLECFGTLLRFFPWYTTHGGAGKDSLSPLALLIISSYLSSFANASNKKKIHSSFVQSYLEPWFKAAARDSNSQYIQGAASTRLYDAGIETLFCVEALRSSQERHAGSTFEKALTSLASTHPGTIVSCLPRLFYSYWQSQTRHQAALYHQSSRQATQSTIDQARVSTMAFHAVCDALLVNYTETRLAWKLRGALLSIIQREDILSRSDQTSFGLLSRIGEEAAATLSFVGPNIEHSDAILTCLSALTLIDYDLVPSSLSRVLPTLQAAPARSVSLHTYLQLLLNHHEKTRTMDTYIIAASQAFTQFPQAIDSRELYKVISSGPLLRDTYLDSMSRSVRNFLTPGQVPEVIHEVAHLLVTTFEGCVSSLDAGDNDRSKEKPQIAHSSAQGLTSLLQFSFLAKSAAATFVALPLHILPPHTRREAQEAVREVICRLLSATLRRVFSTIEKNPRGTWSWQLLLASVLRLYYATATSRSLRATPEREGELMLRVLSHMRLHGTSSELRVEMFRCLLYGAGKGYCDPEKVFDEILDTLEEDQVLGNEIWAGDLHSLDDNTGHSRLQVTVLYLLFNRWLSFFHCFAPDDHVARLVRCLFTTKRSLELPISPTSAITMDSVIRQTFHSAEFWELSRFKDTLLWQINDQTRGLGNITPLALWEKWKGSGSCTAQLPLEADQLHARYEILLHVPLECITRESQSDFLCRAITADAIVTLTEAKTEYYCSLLSNLRQFISRVLPHVDFPNNAFFMPHLLLILDFESSAFAPEVPLTPITEQLVRLYTRAILPMATKRNENDLADLLDHILSRLNLPSTRESSLSRYHVAILSEVVNMFTNEYKPSHFSTKILQALSRLQERLFSFLLPEITANANTPHLLAALSLELWHRLLQLRRWMGVNVSKTPQIARSVVGMLTLEGIQRPTDQDVAALSIAIEELNLQVPDRPQHLEFLAATCISFFKAAADVTGLEVCLSDASKAFSPTDYGHILRVILDGLGSDLLHSELGSSLLRLFGVLIRSPPEGSLKVIQAATSQCFGLFANRPTFSENTPLMSQALKLVSMQFNDRPAIIRSVDMPAIWSFINHCLTCTSSHDEKTDPTIYQEIVSILSALVRLRRDLLLPTLPLLASTLHNLLLLLRAPPPNLGATQLKLIFDKFPRWVVATDPITYEESKALARLLTTLTAKTVIRTHGTSSTDPKKAASLARPFSKHAPHVLIAYLNALNDPLCSIPLVVRRTLEPGLFALCDMMGEQNRDALMVTLSAGEKTVMRAIWQGYEKQRYVGRG